MIGLILSDCATDNVNSKWYLIYGRLDGLKVNGSWTSSFKSFTSQPLHHRLLVRWVL